MKEKAELVLEALIAWIDEDDNPVEGLTNDQLRQRTGLSPSDLKKTIKSLYEEGCFILAYASGKTPLDFKEISISSEGIKKYAKLLAGREAEKQKELVFKQLLHPTIIESSYSLFLNGHLREAVLSAITAVFDSVRKKTGSRFDGKTLVRDVFYVDNPKLLVGDLSAESGMSIQIGFANILQGAYQSIRNPLAHSTQLDIDEDKAKQCLIFASLLARYVEESRIAK